MSDPQDFASFEAQVTEKNNPVEAPEEESPSPAESPPPEAEAPEAEATGEETPEAEAPAPEAETPAPERKKTAQERINDLTRARREAERRAEALERELAQLRSQPPAPPQPQTPAAAETTEQASDGPPDPNSFEFGTLDERYIAALANYHAEKRIAEFRKEQEQERQAEAQRTRQRELQARVEKMIESGAQKHEDFYEKVFIGAEKGAWRLSEDLGQLLVQSEVGADIAYHLASHPEEAASVFAQSPLEQARYFGRMEAKFSATQGAAPGHSPAGNPATVRTPKAPPPVLPARGAGGRFQTSASSTDFSAFEAAVQES